MSYNHLTMDERNMIYRMQWQGYSSAEIACCLGRHRSTIGRECRRNRSCQGSYDPGRLKSWLTAEGVLTCIGPKPASAV
jgi:IS30 family transposase